MTLQTLFGQERFIAAVTSTGIHGYRPIRLRADLVGVQERARRGLRTIQLAPFGLYAGLGVSERDVTAAVREVLGELRGVRTISCRWNVRYDHTPIATALERAGVPFRTASTHVLRVPRTHADAFAAFSTTRRRQVRRANEEVRVRRATDRTTLLAYHRIHQQLSADKARGEDYPLSIFEALLGLPETMLLVAEREGAVLAGALFFRDGDSLFYWHGAADRAASSMFPSCAIFDHAIRLACEEGFSTVNFGGSLGVASLEEFKASWGARPESYWKFTWSNPVWRAIRWARGYSRRLWQRRA